MVKSNDVSTATTFASRSPRDKDGRLVGGNDPYAQSVQAFQNMKTYLEAAGATMNDVVKINCYLTDITDRRAFIAARREFFTGDFPAAGSSAT